VLSLVEEDGLAEEGLGARVESQDLVGSVEYL
jgi:hypothetical protein